MAQNNLFPIVIKVEKYPLLAKAKIHFLQYFFSTKKLICNLQGFLSFGLRSRSHFEVLPLHLVSKQALSWPNNS
jgi:hypothetical protein